MSPIFNQSALHGLSPSTLERLRLTLVQTLAAPALTEAHRAQLRAALQAVEAILRQRAAAPVPPAPAPSP